MKQNSSKEFWKEILHGKKILSDVEAEEIFKETKRMRKEKGFRTYYLGIT